jgi:hypothetical protein
VRFLLNSKVKKSFGNLSRTSTLMRGVVSDERRIPARANRALQASRQTRGSLHRKRLLGLAAEYEARIFELEKGYRPSPASQLLKPDEPHRG